MFQILFVLFTAIATSSLLALDSRGLRELAGGLSWTFVTTWIWALGEELARGVSLRLTVEKRVLREALFAAAAAGLLLGLLERLFKTNAASLSLPIALQIAGQLRATLFHPAMSVLVVLLRMRWRWPLWLVIGGCSAIHAAMNLAPHLIHTQSVVVEILGGYAFSILFLVAILGFAFRETWGKKASIGPASPSSPTVPAEGTGSG